jgi:hypothetical protein
MAKLSNPKGTANARLGINAVAILTRRKIDVFIIEGRNLTGVGSDKRSSSPYVRLRFGNHKKYRTQVRRCCALNEGVTPSSLDIDCQINGQSKVASVVHVRYIY